MSLNHLMKNRKHKANIRLIFHKRQPSNTCTFINKTDKPTSSNTIGILKGSQTLVCTKVKG